MIKFTQGEITTMEGMKKPIVVKATSTNSLKDALIGGGIVLIGIAYLTYTAFLRGSKAFDNAEFQTLVDLGLIHE